MQGLGNVDTINNTFQATSQVHDTRQIHIKSLKTKQSYRIASNQFKSNQIKSNQIKSNQIKSNQIKSNQIKSNQIKLVTTLTPFHPILIVAQTETQSMKVDTETETSRDVIRYESFPRHTYHTNMFEPQLNLQT
jgi:hypothetical protein